MTDVAAQERLLADWDTLARELDAWADSGRTADLWLRDDDAVAHTPALDHLLQVALELPIALAVIPARAEAGLAERISREPACAVLQHGYAHVNHAPAGARKSEYGADRPRDVMLDELRVGRARLAELFGSRLLPVLAPPWNRLADELTVALPLIGITGVSGFRSTVETSPGPRRIDTHIDPIDWRNGRGHRGDPAILGILVDELRLRRCAADPTMGPIGLLTHHLVTDAAGWRFIERLVAQTRSHPAICWRSAAELFAT